MSSLAEGRLSLETASKLREAILKARHTPISNECHPNAVISRLDEQTIKTLNEQHIYRELDQPTKDALFTALNEIKDSIAGALGTWSVATCRSWTTQKGATEFGPNAWHTDGKFKNHLKLMIYSSEEGGIELEDKIISGMGSWVVFRNEHVKHRGLAPTGDGIRVATEVTIKPSAEFDLLPRTLGLVAKYLR